MLETQDATSMDAGFSAEVAGLVEKHQALESELSAIRLERDELARRAEGFAGAQVLLESRETELSPFSLK